MAKPGEASAEEKKTPGAPPAPSANTPAVAAAAPKGLAVKNANPDLANFNSDEFLIPRLRLGQGLTPEVMEGKIKSGDFFDSVEKKSYGEKVRVILLAKLPASRIKWNPRDQGGWACISQDAITGSVPQEKKFLKDNEEVTVYGTCDTCHFTKFGTNDDPKKKSPGCTRYITYLALIPGEVFPIAVSFERSKFKVGSQLSTQLAKMLSKDPAARLRQWAFSLFRVIDEGGGNKYFGIRYEPAGESTVEERAEADEVYDLYAKNADKAVVHMEDELDETAETPAAAGSGEAAPF